MAETLGEVHLAAVDVVEQHAVPLAERRRADADVDDDVERGAADARDVLGLTRRDVGEVDAPQHAGGRDRAVGLGELEVVAGVLA